jgi:hypothetical protein
MQPFYEMFTDHCELLPTLTVGAIKCSECDEDHGWSISVAWLFRAAGIGFVSHGE